MNTILAITYTFLLSFCPYDNIGVGNNSTHHDNATHVQYELGADLFNTVRLFTGEETYQVPFSDFFSWTPYSQVYYVGVEYHHEFDEKLSVSAGATHTCQHPLNVWGTQKSDFNRGKTEIYVKVSGKLDIF